MNYNEQFINLLKTQHIREALSNKDFNYLYQNLQSADTIIQFTHFCQHVLKVDPLQYMDYIPYYYLKHSGIKNYTIPNNIITIGKRAFAYCESLESIVIPNNVRSIGEEAFAGCPNLKNVSIGNNVRSIGSHAFYDCPSLTSIEIPNNVTSILQYTFCHCSSLENVTIPDTVTYIGTAAFFKCTSLKSITIPDTATDIEIDAFSGCPIEKAIIPVTACYSVKNDLLKEVIITSGDSISDFAFQGCISLENIIIPNSITSIGCYAFRDCPKLKEITFKGTKEEVLIILEVSDKRWRNGSSVEKIICNDGIIEL